MDYPWRVKLRRARELLAALRTDIDAYLERDDVGFDYPHDPKRNEIAVVVKYGEPPPDRLAAIIGDILQNLRSALDAVAWAVVTSHGEPPEKAKIYFPIVREAKDWASTKGRLPGISDDELEVFRKLQRWHWEEDARAAGIEDPPQLGEDPLVRLNDMAAEDRHKSHLPLVAQGGPTWLGAPPGVTVQGLPADSAPWGSGSTVMRWVLPQGVTPNDLHLDGKVFLALTPDDALRERDVLNVLESMSQAVLTATRTIEIEVLRIVTDEHLAELKSLNDEVERASEEKLNFSRSPNVPPGEVVAEFKRLDDVEQAARERQRVRTYQILG